MTNEHDIKEKVLERIRAEDVTMRPKVYFTLQLAAVALVALLVLVVSVFLFNFILFSIRISGHEALLGFGPRGYLTFFYIFPWHWLIIDIGLILLLEWLLRKFRFGYKTPVVYLLILLIAAVLPVGFVLDRATPLNDRLMERAERGGLPPPLGGFFEGARRPPPPGSGVCRCKILAIEGNTLTVEDIRQVRMGNATSTLTVLLPSDNPRATTTGLTVGETVFIAGREEDGVIHAFGVRKDPPPDGKPLAPRSLRI